MQIEDRVSIASDLLRVGLTMEHAEGASIALRGLHTELAGDEREQVGGQRLSLSKTNSLRGAVRGRATPAPGPRSP